MNEFKFEELLSKLMEDGKIITEIKNQEILMKRLRRMELVLEYHYIVVDLRDGRILIELDPEAMEEWYE